jgi:hypothetical protein
MRCQKELDRLRAQPLTQEQPLSQEQPAAAEPPELLAVADAARQALAPAAAPSVPKLSRQQRRLAERLAERERRRQPHSAHPNQARQVERTLLSLNRLEAALSA